ncbi:MAG: glycosyltransferase [Lentimicrobium sp.]|jgi:glycosyltransferase involved in cell wall biosynthesis|nr:glycosyltransferase [Lentimicrobium sp.]
MQKRKVVIIGSAYPLRGGLSNFNERLAEEFVADDWNTEIYTFSLQYPRLLFPGKTQLSTESYKGNVPIRVVINSINPLNWIKIGLNLKKINPDLIVVKFWIPFMAPCFGTILRIAKTNKFTKIITVIDNIIPHEKRPGDYILAKYFSGSIDGFVTMSRKVLEDVAHFDTKKPRVFSPHPIYDNFGETIEKRLALEELGLNPSFNYILFFGFIRDYKGLDILLKAMVNPEIRALNIKLIVAGEFYTDSKPYYELIKSLGIEDVVIMSNDFIPDGDVNKYFSACDVVVQPYKSATQSGVTQIAYHFNKPMIITNVGGLGEFVPDGIAGFVVEPNSEAVAESIISFYKENREKVFSANVAELKEKYSWKYFLRNLKSLFGY